MPIFELSAITLYFIALLAVGILSYKKNLSESDFIIGGRSMNPWLTAMAAQASDMSAWLFMGFPGAFLLVGMNQIWVGIGLVLFMFINWHFIAPKIRVATEKHNNLTFSSFFESTVKDHSGAIRIFTALISIFFYTIYVSSGVVAIGLLLDTLFQIPYHYGIIIGLGIIIPYVLLGGFRTLAWIDLFQGFFLLGMILFVPLYIFPKVGGFSEIMRTLKAHNLSTTLFSSGATPSQIFLWITSWGLGYFGQPHIVTKFMGIRDVKEIPKSKYIGLTWMVLSLGAASLVGLVGVAFFQGFLPNPDLVYISMVRDSFHPFLIGLIFCAVLATTINANGSQILILTSNLSEDLYKKLVRPKASSSELLLVSRLGVLFIALGAYLIALKKFSIYNQVFYAFSGIGSSFGPLLIFSLYFKKINRYGAWAGILTGSIVSASWPLINRHLSFDLPSLIPGFLLSSAAIFITSILTQRTSHAKTR